MEHEFKSFPEIKKLGSAAMYITQKIHGSNAQVFVFQTPEGGLDLLVGSRTRWIAPGNDNYGFAAHVYANKEAFLKLGPGQHFGEWTGPGINSGEGLSDKTLVLFDHWKFPPERELPPQTVVVPVLYEGAFDLSKVDGVMADLKENGSKLVPGFMRPEGVVVRIKGDRYKVVFQAEETKWKSSTKAPKDPNQTPAMDVSHLLQPIRLEKLLSRDEIHVVQYPQSLPRIVSAYIDDLIKEDQIVGTEAEIKGIKKVLSRPLFAMVQEIMEKALHG